MDTDDHRADLLERAYRRGYELKLRRRRWSTVCASFVLVVVVAVTAVAISHADNPKVSVLKRPRKPVSCAPGIDAVPKARVPRDVADWAGGAPVVGHGALWTIRSAIAVAPDHQAAGWLLKFPWDTRPFGLPTISGRRLDGPGAFHADAHPATDSRGTWVVSSLIFSGPGCWEVTGRYRASTMRFRIHVIDETRAAPAEVVALE
jgi:hypothetical protein